MGGRRAGLVVSVWIAFILLVAVFGVALNVPLARGSGTIYIRADGSIDPPTAPMQRNEDAHTFTDRIDDSTIIKRDKIASDRTERVESSGLEAFNSASPPMQWNKTYEGGLVAYAVVQACDGGYAMAGEASLSDPASPHSDFWLVKTDAYGNVQWNKKYGGYWHDVAYSVVQTIDGGYAMAGQTSSFSGGYYSDFWLVKTDAYGNMQWHKTYGRPLLESFDVAYSVVQTGDSGYAMAGETDLFSSWKPDAWLVKDIPPVQNIDTGLSYNTIQEAIDASETLDGHTIKVQVRTYYEHLTVTKSLRIIGEDRTSTIIDGSITGTFVVRINANNVVLSGFTIQKSNAAPTPAIRIDSSNNVISNNTIISNGWGIYSFSVSNNTIENNVITNNVYGIYLEWVTTHTFNNNTIVNQQEAGIYLRESRNNIFTNNTVRNNKDGIVLISDSNCNKFYHNNFVDNTSQGFTVNSDTNTWDNGYPSGGNYWSDYGGVDVKSGPNQDQPGSDGIGDTPHTFSGPNQDRYPLMNLIGSLQPPIANFAYTPESPVKGETVTFNATSSYDRDGSITTFKWDFDDGNITTTTNPIIIHVYTASGTYTVNLTITDNDGLSHSITKPITVTEDSIAPTTLHDYDDSWHTTDFTITLTATDDLSGVAETYYRINNGPIQNVTTNGQPLITTEGANNRLEYWSIDNAGNEELPHKILTGIKLDKTCPTIETPSRTPDGDVLPDQSVKVSVNVTDLVSQVKNVTLFYTLDNGTTWEEPLPMNLNSLTNLYEATILGQEAGTWVRFKIVAYDYAGNNRTLDGTEPYCVYQVVPEFPPSLILPIFIIITLLAAIAYRRKHQTLQNHI